MPEVLHSRLVSIPWTEVHSPGVDWPDTVRTDLGPALVLSIGLLVDPALDTVGCNYTVNFRTQNLDTRAVFDDMVSGRLSALAAPGTRQPVISRVYPVADAANVNIPGVYLFRPYIFLVADTPPPVPSEYAGGTAHIPGVPQHRVGRGFVPSPLCRTSGPSSRLQRSTTSSSRRTSSSPDGRLLHGVVDRGPSSTD